MRALPKRVLHTFLFHDEGNLPKLVEYLTANHYMALISPLHDQDHWTNIDIERYLQHQERRFGIKIDRDADHWDRPTGHYVVVNGKRRRHTEEVPIPKVGDPKKPHRHVIVRYDMSVPKEQVWREFVDYGFDLLYFEDVKNERSLIRYLVHLDNPEKTRYHRADVMSLGGYDMQPLYDETRQDKNKNTKELLDYIEKHPRIKSFKYLVHSLQHDKQEGLVFELKTSSYFWNKLLYDPLAKRDKTKEDGTVALETKDPTQYADEDFDPTTCTVS